MDNFNGIPDGAPAIPPEEHENVAAQEAGGPSVAPAPFVQLKATVIGEAARQALAGNPPVTTAGVTSLGVFLRLDERKIVFLSTESFHSPLTLNLSGDPAPLLRLAPGEPAMITDDGVVFPAHDLEVLAVGALPWQAPAPPRGRLPAGRMRARLRETVEHLVAAEADPALAPGLLLDLRRLIARAPVPGDAGSPFLTILKRLSRALLDSQPLAVSAALQECLGRGPGLTPSGDDLSLGFLLALRRWGDDLGLGVAVDSFQAGLLIEAERQTTLLAANLMACAADGQADERLVTALDGIVTGSPDAATCAAYFRGWGSSSGIDALAGMASVLLAAP